MCNRLTKLSVTMWYTFFGIFDDTSLWILPKTHDPSLCDTPDEWYKKQKQKQKSTHFTQNVTFSLFCGSASLETEEFQCSL